MQFETILPFLRPIEHLILDPDISEIMVNADSRIFIEKHGQLLPVPGITISEQALCAAVKNIARRLGDDISEAKPIWTPACRMGVEWQRSFLRAVLMVL